MSGGAVPDEEGRHYPQQRSHYPEQYVDQSGAARQDPVAYVLHEGFTALCRHLAELTEVIARGAA